MESAFELRAAACAAAAAAAYAAAAAAAAPDEAQTHQDQPTQQKVEQQPLGPLLYPALADLAARIQLKELSTLQAIRSCIRCAGSKMSQDESRLHNVTKMHSRA